jgi:hypothetical protein
MVQHPARKAEVRRWLLRKNRKGIAAEAQAVYNGADIAYKHGDRPGAQADRGRKSMATKKKATKKLTKGKKLQPTKPLTVAVKDDW